MHFRLNLSRRRPRSGPVMVVWRTSSSMHWLYSSLRTCPQLLPAEALPAQHLADPLLAGLALLQLLPQQLGQLHHVLPAGRPPAHPLQPALTALLKLPRRQQAL